LTVTNVHRHIVCPSRHLAGDFRSGDREIRRWHCVTAEFPEVGDRGKEKGLKILAEMILALSKCRDWKIKAETQERKEEEDFLVHRHPPASNWIRIQPGLGSGGIGSAIKSCLLRKAESTRILAFLFPIPIQS
jgi:hypothetical protein